MLSERTERQPPAAARPYTLRTFSLCFARALVVSVAVFALLAQWLPADVARGAAGGASIPVPLSGNPRWREPRVLPWSCWSWRFSGQW